MNRYLIYIIIIFLLLFLFIFNCSRYDFLTESEWNDLYNNKNDNNTAASNSSYSYSSWSSMSFSISSSSSSSTSSSSISSSSSSSGSSIISLYSNVFGTPAVDEGTAITADDGGYVYAAGNTYGNYAGLIGNSDIIITQFDPAGNYVWKRQIGSPYDDFVYDMKFFAGSLYITGSSYGSYFNGSSNSDSNMELFIAQLNSTDGSILNSFQLDMFNYDTSGSAIEADSSGVYITGYTKGSFYGEANPSYGTSDIIVAKYELNLGSCIWYDQIGIASIDTGLDLVIDSANSYIYITGVTNGSLFPGAISALDFFLAQYPKNGSGNIVPNNSYQYGGSNNDYSTGITMDNSGNIYITGFTNSDDFISTLIGGYDIFIIKIHNSDLSIITDQNKFGSINNDSSTKIKFRDEGIGFLYLATVYSSGMTADQITLFKIRADDLLISEWSNRILYSSGNDKVNALCLDNSGFIYYTGTVNTNSYYDFYDIYSGKYLNGYMGDDDVFIIKYDSTGYLQ